MSGDADISGLLAWEDGLPVPQWDMVEAWVDTHDGPDARRAAWAAANRQWLAELGPALGAGYTAAESGHFLALVPAEGVPVRALLAFAERCRERLRAAVGDAAEFEAWGKTVFLLLQDADDYYRYISRYFPEGEHGGSGGVHIREGMPHVALHGRQMWLLESVLAHEFTHVALRHLGMPQWLEEGLAQTFEHDATGRSLLAVGGAMARRHKRHWGTNGLDDFWRGESFSRPGKLQRLSYELAEILVCLLAEEGKPRWFGWVQEPQRRYLAFLHSADELDCGAAACRQHLGYDLGDLAAKFLGPGEWSPGL